MAEKSFGFNSAGTAPGDRAYVASDYMFWLNVHFGGHNGVISGFLNELAVTSLGSYSIAVNTGGAVFNGHAYSNDSSLTKTLSSAATTFKRYDRLVVRFDDVGARLAVVAVIEGTASTGTPTIPSLGAKDVALATVYVNNTTGTPTFTITDDRVYRVVPLGVNNVATSNITDSAVTNAKIGSGAVTDSKAGALTSAAMAPGYRFTNFGNQGSIGSSYTLPSLSSGSAGVISFSASSSVVTISLPATGTFSFSYVVSNSSSDCGVGFSGGSAVFSTVSGSGLEFVFTYFRE